MKFCNLFLLCFVILFSCDTITQKQFEFIYYPSRNVYYDVANKLYFYSLDGGTTWDSLQVTRTNQPAIPGPQQTIYSTTPDIFANNAQHIKQYNGTLIDINGTYTDSINGELVAERKIKKVKATPAIVENTGEEKKTEKKPGFFKRLFGKKNNNQ
jgi:hypothetical protein